MQGPNGAAHDRFLQSALEASEARFRDIIENNADGILVVTSEGTIQFANQAATKLLNRQADVLVGQPFGVPIIPGETTEVDLPFPDSLVRIAEMRVVETRWDGQPALLASLRDISDRKRLEEELRQKIAELALADRRKDEFLAILAHELRNPLAPILNAVHVTRLKGEDAEIRSAMRNIIEQQIRVMSRLVDDLLDVSRIRRGRIQLRAEPVTLSSIIQLAIETTRPLFVAKQHDLRVFLPAEPLRLWADPVRLEQVVANLLTNAAKYTRVGGLIRLRALVDCDDIVISVADNGIGIAPEMLESIFEIFTQVDHTLARTEGGLGVGLTLARNLVELHNGVLLAKSDGLGKGSEFIVRLPHEKADLLAGDQCDDTPRLTSSAGGSRRVLILEDNVASAHSLGLILKLWGHECRVTHNGPECIEAALHFSPDVVLLDIGVPGMDGYAVAHELNQQTNLRGVVLIAMTGYGRDEDRLRSTSAGFSHHLVKPLDLEVLEGLLGRLEINRRSDS